MLVICLVDNSASVADDQVAAGGLFWLVCSLAGWLAKKEDHSGCSRYGYYVESDHFFSPGCGLPVLIGSLALDFKTFVPRKANIPACLGMGSRWWDSRWQGISGILPE